MFKLKTEEGRQIGVIFFFFFAFLFGIYYNYFYKVVENPFPSLPCWKGL